MRVLQPDNRRGRLPAMRHAFELPEAVGGPQDREETRQEAEQSEVGGMRASSCSCRVDVSSCLGAVGGVDRLAPAAWPKHGAHGAAHAAGQHAQQQRVFSIVVSGHGTTAARAPTKLAVAAAARWWRGGEAVVVPGDGGGRTAASRSRFSLPDLCVSALFHALRVGGTAARPHALLPAPQC